MKGTSESRFWTTNLKWILTIQVVAALVYHGFATLIPFVQTEFALTKAEVGYMTSGMFLGSSIIAIPAGFVTDKIGVRNTLTLFCFTMALVLYLFIFIKLYVAVVLLLVFLGFGYGAIAPATNRGIMEEFSEKNRGTAMGIKQMGVPLGVVIATICLPTLAHVYSWRISLFIIGSVLLVITLIYYFTNRKEISAETPPKSMTQLKMVIFNKKTIILSIIIASFMGMQVSVTTFLVIYLYQSVQFSFAFSTFCFSLLFSGGVLGRALWGYISDTFFNSRRKVILFFIGTLSAIILLLFSFVHEGTSMLVVMLLSLLLGFTTQGWNGISIVMIAERATSTNVGLTTGFGLTIVNVGAIIGAPLAGVIVDISGSYKMMWNSIALIMMIVSIIIIFLKMDNTESA